MNSTSLASSEGVTMISLDTDGKMVIISRIKKEPDDCAEVTEGDIDLADPEISKVNREEFSHTFLETSESDSSTEFINHVKQEPELSIVSKLPPVAEHEQELRKQLSVNLRKFDTKWIKKSRLFETFFNCPKCQIVTKNGNAERHVMACSGPITPTIYHCYRCQESFNLKEHWEIHMRKHRRKTRQNDCKDCGEKFKTWNLLANHRKLMGEHKSLQAKNHTSNQKTTCKGCGKKFISKEKFSNHRKLKKCIYCDKEFECKYARMQHFREDHGQDFKCPKCPYVGMNLKGLTIHSFSHSKETLEETSKNTSEFKHIIHINNQYKCNKCGIKFDHMSDILKHQNRMGRYKCIVCDQEFECTYAKNKHFRGVHGQDFKCPKCSYIGKNLKALKEHSSYSHTSVYMNNQYICDKCGQKFNRKANIINHQNSMGNYKCTVCDQEFKCKYARNKHFRGAHGQDFKCSKCSYVGKNLKVLTIHSFSHENHKNTFHFNRINNQYICDKCGRKFNSKAGILIHQHRMGKHKCFVCDQEFECRYARTRHYQVAHGSCLQNSECDICGEEFFLKSDLRQHIMNTHVNLYARKPKRSTEHHSVTASEALKYHDYCTETGWIQSSYYHCYQCKETFDSRKLLNCHNAKHHPIVCGYCGKEFCSQKSLNVHQSTCNCKCFICDEKFKCRSESGKHYQSAHGNKLCPKCPFVGETISELKLHCLMNHQTPAEIQPSVSNKKLQSDFDNADSNENIETLITSSGFSESTAIPEIKTSFLDFRVRNVESDDFSEVIEGESDLTNPEIEEFLETSESESSRDHNNHIKQEPEFSIVSKLPPLAEDEDELKEQLIVNSQNFDAMVENSTEKHVVTCRGPISPTIYRCDQCQESFNLREHWQDHMRKHKSTRELQCDYCGQNFKCETHLKIHQNFLGNHKCGACNTEFKYIFAKIKHNQDVHFKCPKCSYVSKSRRELKQHSEVHRNKTERYTCDKKFECHGALDKHKSAHKSEKSEASFVLKLPADEVSLETETIDTTEWMNNVKQEPEVSYVVKLPPAFQNVETQPIRKPATIRFHSDNRTTNLLRHKHLQHHASNYQCYQCKETFDSRILLNGHNLKHHSVTCSYCGKEFCSQNSIKQHQSSNCTCFICDEKFKCSSGSGKHYRLAHDDKLCPKCPFIGTTISALKSHFLTNHPILRKVTSQSNSQHRIISTNSKTESFEEFICSICNKKFKCHGELNKHKSVHQSKKTKASFVLKLPADETETIDTPDRMNNVKQEPEVSYVVKLPSADKAFQNIETQPIRKSDTFRFHSDSRTPIPNTDSHKRSKTLSGSIRERNQAVNEFISSSSKTLSGLIKEKSRLRIQNQ